MMFIGDLVRLGTIDAGRPRRGVDGSAELVNRGRNVKADVIRRLLTSYLCECEVTTYQFAARFGFRPLVVREIPYPTGTLIKDALAEPVPTWMRTISSSGS